METVFPARGTLAPSIPTPQTLPLRSATHARRTKLLCPTVCLSFRPPDRCTAILSILRLLYLFLYLLLYFISVYLFSLVNEEAALVSFGISFFLFLKDTESQDFYCDFKCVRSRWIREQTTVGEISNVVLDSG